MWGCAHLIVNVYIVICSLTQNVRRMIDVLCIMSHTYSYMYCGVRMRRVLLHNISSKHYVIHVLLRKFLSTVQTYEGTYVVWVTQIHFNI